MNFHRGTEHITWHTSWWPNLQKQKQWIGDKISKVLCYYSLKIQKFQLNCNRLFSILYTTVSDNIITIRMQRKGTSVRQKCAQKDVPKLNGIRSIVNVANICCHWYFRCPSSSRKRDCFCLATWTQIDQQKLYLLYFSAVISHEGSGLNLTGWKVK